MEIKSIYRNHYEGQTYRVGVAYLRARSETDDRSPAKVGVLTVDEQRAQIRAGAQHLRMIIVAEFIEYGTDFVPGGWRPALQRMIRFGKDRGVRECLVAEDAYLADGRRERRLIKFELGLFSMTAQSAGNVISVNRWLGAL